MSYVLTFGAVANLTTSLARSTWPDVRNSFVILFSVDVSAAELAFIRRKDNESAITGPQTDFPRSLLDFIIAPFRPSTIIGFNFWKLRTYFFNPG